MINLIGCLTVFAIALLVSNIDSISDQEARIMTILGWFIALCFARGGI